jgi:hypothetical protein
MQATRRGYKASAITPEAFMKLLDVFVSIEGHFSAF